MATATQPRFTAGSHYGRLTVRDHATDLVVVHQAEWDDDIAAFVVAELTEEPRRVAHFTWEGLS